MIIILRYIFIITLLSTEFIFADQSKYTINEKDNFNKIFANVLIESFGENHPVNAFYLENNYNFFWVNNPYKIDALLGAIRKSKEHGLNPKRYNFDFLKNNINNDNSLTEINAMKSFVLLCQDLHSGLVEPSKISEQINVTKKNLDFEKIFNLILEGKNIETLVYSLAPKTNHYKNLLTEYKRLNNIVKLNLWGEKVPENLVLGFQLRHANVSLLRSRLHRMGYLSFDNKDDFFDAELRSSVQLFQSDFGLNDDGVAGFFTLKAINVPAYTRLIQVIVNIERAKWMNYEENQKYVLVNQPNFKAKMYSKNEVIWESRVVIGLPDHQTAEFNNEISHLVINPTWHVPTSIAIDEYLPLIKEDENFLNDNDMILKVRGTNTTIDPSLIDMTVFEQNNFPFLIKQRPSNVNPLGVVKFMFPNRYNIYMHDTPMKELFFKDQRMFSHGCVRLQDPFEFAYTLLSAQNEFPKTYFEKLLNSKKEIRVNLKETVPVHIIYRTVFFNDYNQTQFREDIYGRDALVYMKLLDEGLEFDL